MGSRQWVEKEEALEDSDENSDDGAHVLVRV